MELVDAIFIMLVLALVLVSICLGLIVGVLIMWRRRNAVQQAKPAEAPDAPNASSTDDGKKQLDRIEAAINQTSLTSTRFGILAIGLAAVIASATGLEMDAWVRVVLLLIGYTVIIVSRRIPAKWLKWT